MSSTLQTFFQLQLDRIKGRPTPHADGPKRPDLAELDEKLTLSKKT